MKFEVGVVKEVMAQLEVIVIAVEMKFEVDVVKEVIAQLEVIVIVVVVEAFQLARQSA
jgi:cellobiose-specific phosphotransferase system component IIB